MATKTKTTHELNVEEPPQGHQPLQTATPQAGGKLQVYDYGEDAGDGVEDIGADEMLVPFLRILQSNSPQVDESESKYIPGAEAGMIFNTATSELYDGKVGIPVVICKRDHNFPEFIPRDNGGGFVAIHAADDEMVHALRQQQGQFGKLKRDNGNELTETYYHYVIALPGEGEPLRGVVGYASTQIKKYKMLSTRIKGLAGSPPKFPIFAFRWRLRVVPEKNKKGKFFGWKIDLDGESRQDALLRPSDPLYLDAREFAAMLKEGVAKADWQSAAAAGGVADEEPETGTSGYDNDPEAPPL